MSASDYRTSFPAAAPESAHWTDRVVTEGHVAACREFGHAKTIVDGVDQHRCPRCGESTYVDAEPLDYTSEADLAVADAGLDEIVAVTADDEAEPQPCPGCEDDENAPHAADCPERVRVGSIVAWSHGSGRKVYGVVRRLYAQPISHDGHNFRSVGYATVKGAADLLTDRHVQTHMLTAQPEFTVTNATHEIGVCDGCTTAATDALAHLLLWGGPVAVRLIMTANGGPSTHRVTIER